MKLSFEIVQLIGGRDNQEDCISIAYDDSLSSINDNSFFSSEHVEKFIIAICDGMGGHEAGEIASKIVSMSFINYFKDHILQNSDINKGLNLSCLFANQILADEILKFPNLNGMGTTLIGAFIYDGYLNWLSVGDSHLFLFRNNRLQKLNQDHSMVPVIDAMLSKGLISSSEASTHPDRNALRSAISGENISIIDHGILNFKLIKNDVLIFATDGIDVLNHIDIIQSIKRKFWQFNKISSLDLKTKIENLQLKNNDNATICLIYIN